MANARGIKTEHAGAKNGGGFWGPRADAKRYSKRARREADKVATGEARTSEQSRRTRVD
jgi:hypothetical protein